MTDRPGTDMSHEHEWRHGEEWDKQANAPDYAPMPCRKCGGAMKPSQALGQTCTGLPDFIGDPTPVTISPGGPGKMINCIKCENCGWSVTR